jgi:hypothetical protein
MAKPFDSSQSKHVRRRVRTVVMFLFGALFVWLIVAGLRLEAHKQAAEELRGMGFEAGSPNITRQLRTNWRGLFNRKLWQWSDRVRVMSWNKTNLNDCAPALRRFEPRGVMLGFSGALDDVSALRDLPNLERLDFYECPNVRDVGVVSEFKKLKELTFNNSPALRSLAIIQSGAKLQSLHISNCPNLIDLKGLSGLKALRSLYLVGCPELKDTELLRGMSELEELDLSGCAALANVDGLHGLKKLKTVKLHGCKKLQPSDVAALRAAFPGVKVDLPW